LEDFFPIKEITATAPNIAALVVTAALIQFTEDEVDL
jgi:hypothetical protein